MNAAFPALPARLTGMLPVSDIHTLYYEESGNPNGVPVVFLHGGPGGGTDPAHRTFFDPAFYRIILFDQRGSGKSTPSAELRENTTWDLVSDIEKIRTHLGIDKWLVFGGSWGSTLALAYAIRHPKAVTGLILRGIFLCRASEIRWFYQEGASHIFPDLWDKYLAAIPEAEHNDLVTAYYKRLTHSNPLVRLDAALAWSQWEASTSKLILDPDLINKFEEPELALAFSRIECHYFYHDSFMPTPNYLLEQVPLIRHIPTRIIQGRYDVVCPIRSAWDLHKAFPEAELRIVPDAGHAAFEKGILHELVQATEDFKELRIKN